MAGEAQHGTRSGYGHHRRNGTPPCEGCRMANAVYQQERWANRPDVRRQKQDAKRRRERVAAAVLQRFKREFPEEYYGIWAEEAERLT